MAPLMYSPLFQCFIYTVQIAFHEVIYFTTILIPDTKQSCKTCPRPAAWQSTGASGAQFSCAHGKGCDEMRAVNIIILLKWPFLMIQPFNDSMYAVWVCTLCYGLLSYFPLQMS